MNNDPTAAGEDCILASLERPSNYRLCYKKQNLPSRLNLRKSYFFYNADLVSVMWGVNCLKQDFQDLSDFQEWTSLLPKTPVIELPNYFR